MKHSINKLLLLSVIGQAFFISSCKKIVDTGLPPSLQTAESVFKDSVSAVAATLNMYNYLTTFQSTFDKITSAYIDDLNNVNGGSDGTTFFSTILPTDNVTVYNAWKYPYEVIYQSNAVLEGMQENHSLSPALQTRLTGDAKFCRAYAYFYLVNIFGEVPLVLTTNVTNTSTPARNSTQTVYAQIIRDLQDAEHILQPSYSGEERVRATNMASAALLARVYLYNKLYTQADSAATAVINSGNFSLQPLSGVFKKTSNETILEFYNKNGYTVGSSLIPSSNTTRPQYSLNTGLYNALSLGDGRIGWVSTSTVSSVNYYYPYKYRATTSTQPNGPEYQISLRLAEQYLIRSEAKGHGSQPSDGLPDFNVIHIRAGLTAIGSVSNLDQLDSLVLQERRLELFTEGLQRFFDLKRMGKIESVMSAAKPSTWQPRAELFPIPYNEILINPNLRQNTGY